MRLCVFEALFLLFGKKKKKQIEGKLSPNSLTQPSSTKSKDKGMFRARWKTFALNLTKWSILLEPNAFATKLGFMKNLHIEYFLIYPKIQPIKSLFSNILPFTKNLVIGRSLTLNIRLDSLKSHFSNTSLKVFSLILPLTPTR